MQDAIITLYAKYQLLSWWGNFGMAFAVPFGVVFSISLCVWIMFSADGEDCRIPRLIALISLPFLVVGLVVCAWASYQTEVVLKPEIARLVIPAGFDLVSKVGQQVYDMWIILKGLLAK